MDYYAYGDGVLGNIQAPRAPLANGDDQPITTQGEITRNVGINPNEMKKRQMNVQDRPEDCYPGASNAENLYVKPRELLFGYSEQQLSNTFPGQIQEWGFTSLNGLYYGDTLTDQELEETIYFIGVAKIPFDFDSEDQLQHGVSALAAGSISIFNTGLKDIYPGDKCVWKVPPRHNSRGTQLRSKNIPNLAITGKPHGKLLMMVERVDYRDTKYLVEDAYVRMFREDNGGVKNVPFSALGPSGRDYKLNRRQEHALALKQLVLFVGMRFLEAFQLRNIVSINTPKQMLAFKIAETILDAAQLNEDGTGVDGVTIQLQQQQQQQQTAPGQRPRAEQAGAQQGQNAQKELEDLLLRAVRAKMEGTKLEEGRGVLLTKMEANGMREKLAEEEIAPYLYFKKGAQYPESVREEKLEENKQRLLWLASRLGAIGGPSHKERISVNHNWLNDVLNTIFAAAIPDAAAQELYLPTMSEELTDEELVDEIKNPSSLEGHYLSSSINFINQGHEGMGRALHSILRKQFMTATSFAQPAEPLDAVISV